MSLHLPDHLASNWKIILPLFAIILFPICRALWHAFYNLLLHPLTKFPGPTAAGLSECDRFNVIQQLHQKHGPVVRIGPNQVSISSPEVFHYVFVTKCSSFVKSDFYATIQPSIGPKYAGLFNYTDHKRAVAERRDLQPMFSPASLRQYETRYASQLQQLIAAMKSTEKVDMFKLFKYLLLDAIGDLSFDRSFDQLKSDQDHQYVIDFNNAFMLIGLQNKFAWLLPFIPYLPLQSLKDAYFGLQRVFAYSEAQAKQYLDQDASKKRGTLMSGFLDPETGNPKDGYSPWSIALSGHGFIIAGSEASSVALTYMLWLLIKNPEMEKRLRDELSKLPQSYSSVDLAKLPYLDAFVRETLRIYPPAPSLMPRVVPRHGFTLEGIEYPPNKLIYDTFLKTIISAQPYTIHRCTEIFENPDVFNPDRWLGVTAEDVSVADWAGCTRMPIIVGGLSATEDRFGFVQVRIKRHRWHKKILKTNDPLIFSMGWRRFQTMPVYSISDSRVRNRMLKYTLEHMHCFGTFYGPLIAPNSGFSCYQSFSSKNPGFRIATIGTVLNVDEATKIVKKLKLIRAPYKIFKNTAFIRDMFTTSVEIARFKGASIKTVFGVRGQTT
ncbi:cytochrome P450 [Acephala macrosclerotiorum]|nr:cytochrome P450 [Acephala macrosclerotiorum]